MFSTPADALPIKKTELMNKLSVLKTEDNCDKFLLAGMYEDSVDWYFCGKSYDGSKDLCDRRERAKNNHTYNISQFNQIIIEPTEKNIKYSPALKLSHKSRGLTDREIKNNRLCSALGAKNYQKALEITEELLKKDPEDKYYLNRALESSMAIQNWDKAFIYNNKLLEFEQNSEVLLKNKGDIYSMKKDFPNALNAYKKLTENYPTPEYQFALANLYMTNQDFASAETSIQPLYQSNPDNPQFVDAYLNALLAQQKTRQAYWIIKTHHLETTKNGYTVAGDISMLDKDYQTAANNYKNAINLDPSDLILQNRLADSYRMLGYINGPQKIYESVLAKNPNDIDARLGLGYLEIDRKNYQNARMIFQNILRDNPDCRQAKIAIADSYIVNDDNLSALSELEEIPEDDQTKFMKAQTYYDMKMLSDSKQVLKGVASKDAEALRYKIRRDDAITITPQYSVWLQKLEEQFKLDIHKFGTIVSKNVDENTNVFMEYNLYIYSSGGLNQQNNVVNEFRTGVQSRPRRDLEYRADIGVKSFEFGGGLINTDSWVKHYFNDNFNLKLGFKRNNIEQSYLSAVGTLFNGVFTGRSVDNKTYLDFEGKLPHGIYTYGRGAYGVIYSQNLITNQYYEGSVGAGRLLYNNPKNAWINTFAFDIVSYNSGYQYYQTRLYDSNGTLFGGYFSPSYFSATTGNLKMEGNIEKWRLKYGIKAFGGVQTSVTPDSTTPAWGVSPYISYDINDNVVINILYSHSNYADIQRDLFMINAVIRGFKNAKK